MNNMNNFELEKYLICNKDLLKDDATRNILFQNDRHYAFVWIVQALDDFSYVSDDDMVKRILNDSRCDDKINAIITSCKNIESFLNNEKILERIFFSDLSMYIGYLNYSSALIAFNYMIKNGLENNFKFFNHDVQNRLLSNDNIRNMLLSSKYLSVIMSGVGQSGFNLLVSDERAKEFLLNSNIQYIDKLVSSNIVFPLDISLDKRFKNYFLDIVNVSEYRNYINKLEINNGLCAEEIDNIRSKDYDDIISDYENGFSSFSRIIISNLESGKKIDYLLNDDLRLFALKENSNINKDLLFKYDSLYFKEILIDRFFNDIPSNFLKNLQIMINYINSVNCKFDERRYKIYMKILCFDNLSFVDKVNLYNECKMIPNFSEIFYDDYRFCRNYTYSSLTDSAIDVLKDKDKISIEKSKNFGVPIYELSGDDFFAFVHVTNVPKNNIQDSNIWHSGNRKFLSLSYIGNNNLTVFDDPYKYIVFGFSNLDYNRIGHLRESDSFTNYDFDNLNVSRFVQKMYTPSDFVNNTNGYNEVAYLEKSNDTFLPEVKPSYVVCYDEITNGDLLIAKNYGIPIVLIDTKKYNFNTNGIDVNEEDTYIL